MEGPQERGMTDVAYKLVKGKWVLKAMTPKARESMGKYMGGPWEMSKDLFWYDIAEDQLSDTLALLNGLGLNTSLPVKVKVDTRQYTDF